MYIQVVFKFWGTTCYGFIPDTVTANYMIKGKGNAELLTSNRCGSGESLTCKQKYIK